MSLHELLIAAKKQDGAGAWGWAVPSLGQLKLANGQAAVAIMAANYIQLAFISHSSQIS